MTKMLSIINLDNNYNWAISNTKIDAARDLGFTTI